MSSSSIKLVRRQTSLQLISVKPCEPVKNLQSVKTEIKWRNTTQHLYFVNEESGVDVTLLGVLRGEMAIFLPGILCILVL